MPISAFQKSHPVAKPDPEDFELDGTFGTAWLRRKTAAIWGARDNETGVIYLYSSHYQGQQQPSLHAECLLPWANWLQEFRLYQRDTDGKVVKANDHLMDATRYLIVSGRERMCTAPKRISGVREFPFDVPGDLRWMM